MYILGTELHNIERRPERNFAVDEERSESTRKSPDHRERRKIPKRNVAGGAANNSRPNTIQTGDDEGRRIGGSRQEDTVPITWRLSFNSARVGFG